MFDNPSAQKRDKGQLPWLMLLAVSLLAFPLAVVLTGGMMSLVFHLTGSGLFNFHSCPGPVELFAPIVMYLVSLFALLIAPTRILRAWRMSGT
jgi:hypothetical protein